VSRRNAGRPPWLRPDEQERLLSETALYVRPGTVYRLALGAGLSCREIASLTVGAASTDGRAGREAFLVKVGDRRRTDRDTTAAIAVSTGIQRCVERYLAWRRGRCPHVERPMRGVRGRDGVPRCANCGDVMDFLAAPLFVTRFGRAVTPDALRREFASFRDALGLRGWLHFDVLCETFAAGKAVATW
jgi:hypothetical protein